MKTYKRILFAGIKKGNGDKNQTSIVWIKETKGNGSDYIKNKRDGSLPTMFTLITRLMNISHFNSFVTFLYLMLVLYVSKRSAVTRDSQLGVPFWALNVLIAVSAFWMKWDAPYLRITLLGMIALGIVFTYYLSFRKRVKTGLDYLKLVWIMLFFADTMTINTMRGLVFKGFDNSFVNPKMVSRLDHLFDLFLMLYLLLIALIIYTNEKKIKQLT